MSDDWRLSILPWRQYHDVDDLRTRLTIDSQGALERGITDEIAYFLLKLLERKHGYISKLELRQMVNTALGPLIPVDIIIRLCTKTGSTALIQRVFELLMPKDDAKAFLGDLLEKWEIEDIRLGYLRATAMFVVQLVASVVTLILGRVARAVTQARTAR